MKSTSSAALFTTVLGALSTLRSVSGHGVMNGFSVDGKMNKGPVANGPASPDSVIRQVFSIDPIKGADNEFLSCGNKAVAAQKTATLAPGAKMSFVWKGGDGVVAWPHPFGPMLTYMSQCANDDCTDYDSKTAKWFKVDQAGLKPGSGDWFMKDLTTGPGVNSGAPVQLPANIAPGAYVVRHELIALHNAQAVGGAEFYAGCAQATVTGTGTGKPASNELVSLPGAYKDADPGLVVDVFTNAKALKYQFPGPKIAAFVGSSSSTGSGSDANSTSTAKPAGTKGGKGGNCRLKPKPTAQAALGSTGTAMGGASEYKPRHLSRVMRSIADKLH